MAASTKKRAFTVQQIKDWRAYERVRKAGRYNMITEARRAQQATGLSIDSYLFVMGNYGDLEQASLTSRCDPGETA